jgi:hypothetical protein
LHRRRCGRGASRRRAERNAVSLEGIDRAIVEVSFSGCTHRGVRNGRDTARVSQDLLQAIMESLHTGYGFSEL